MHISDAQLEEFCLALQPVVYDAGEIIEERVRQGVKVLRKMDGSPVTAADQLAEDHILKALTAMDIGFPIVGEELVADNNAPTVRDDETYWLVDALDGTKEFIKGTGEYTVNIGLIENKKPVMGIVYAPAKGVLYYGYADKAFKVIGDDAPVSIQTRAIPDQGIDVAASRNHGSKDKVEAYLSSVKVNDFVNSGSSLKFCMIAEGVADVYPRFGPTCEWDTAAAHAVLNAAGGRVVLASDHGVDLSYGKVLERFYNPEFIAISDALLDQQLNLS